MAHLGPKFTVEICQNMYQVNKRLELLALSLKRLTTFNKDLLEQLIFMGRFKRLHFLYGKTNFTLVYTTAS